MTSITLIGVAGFASAWMLLWGAAAAIPVLLHLLNRRRQQTVSWAAMRLLLQTIEKQSKRIRLEQLILLLLRTLILVTLGLALARPYFSPQSAGSAVAAQRAPRLWILMLDNSYSMGYREQQGTRFAAAQTRAIDLVRSSNRGDAFSLITLSSPPEIVIQRPSFDADVTATAIQRLAVFDGGADLASALVKIGDVVTEAGRSSDCPTDVHIVFFSDFGLDTWQEALANGKSQRSLRELASVHTVSYESFASPPESAPSNNAIMAMSVGATRALKDRPLDVEVSVANYGLAEATQVPLQLTANGQTVASQFIDLPPGVSRVVHLPLRPNSTGLMTVSASLPEDRLLADNQRHSVIEIRSEFRVLCVENPHSDLRILKTSLQPPVAMQAALQVTSTSLAELSLMDLNEFDAVVLNDLMRMSENEFTRLMQYVRSGRSLVCLLGQNSDASTWNMLLGNASNLLGFRLLEASEAGDWRIDPLDYASPIAAPFASHPDAGLLTTPIFRFWKIQIDERIQPRPQVELQLQGAAPLIVLNHWGKGRVASLLSAPQTGSLQGTGEAWNAMAAWPSFVPLMQQLVQATLSDSGPPLNLTVGQPIIGSQRAVGEKTQIQILRPDGSENELQTTDMDENGLRTFSYGATTDRGIYQVSIEGNPPRPYAVNINPSQSDLRSVAVEQLPKSTQNDSSQNDASQYAVGVDSDLAEPSNTLVRWLLISLAAMLVAESCLAWSLGRRLA